MVLLSVATVSVSDEPAPAPGADVHLMTVCAVVMEQAVAVKTTLPAVYVTTMRLVGVEVGPNELPLTVIVSPPAAAIRAAVAVDVTAGDA